MGKTKPTASSSSADKKKVKLTEDEKRERNIVRNQVYRRKITDKIKKLEAKNAELTAEAKKQESEAEEIKKQLEEAQTVNFHQHEFIKQILDGRMKCMRCHCSFQHDNTNCIHGPWVYKREEEK